MIEVEPVSKWENVYTVWLFPTEDAARNGAHDMQLGDPSDFFVALDLFRCVKF